LGALVFPSLFACWPLWSEQLSPPCAPAMRCCLTTGPKAIQSAKPGLKNLQNPEPK
jgi:hypothetical protein